MTDIVERLRRNPRGAAFELEHQCADEIERLRAENSTLRNAQKACEHCMTPTYAELRAERDALRALLLDASAELWEPALGEPECPLCGDDEDDHREECLLAKIDAALGKERS